MDRFGSTSVPNFRNGSIPTGEAIAGSAKFELPLTFEELTMDEAVVRAHPEPWNVNRRRTLTP